MSEHMLDGQMEARMHCLTGSEACHCWVNAIEPDSASAGAMFGGKSLYACYQPVSNGCCMPSVAQIQCSRPPNLHNRQKTQPTSRTTLGGTGISHATIDSDGAGRVEDGWYRWPTFPSQRPMVQMNEKGGGEEREGEEERGGGRRGGEEERRKEEKMREREEEGGEEKREEE